MATDIANVVNGEQGAASCAQFICTLYPSVERAQSLVTEWLDTHDHYKLDSGRRAELQAAFERICESYGHSCAVTLLEEVRHNVEASPGATSVAKSDSLEASEPAWLNEVRAQYESSKEALLYAESLNDQLVRTCLTTILHGLWDTHLHAISNRLKCESAFLPKFVRLSLAQAHDSHESET